MFQRGGKPESVDAHQPHAFRRVERRGLRGLLETGVAGRHGGAQPTATRGMGVCAVPGCGKWPDDLIHAPQEYVEQPLAAADRSSRVRRCRPRS